LHRLNLTTLAWSGTLSCSGVVPAAAYGPTPIVSGNYLYYFGGNSGAGVYQNDVHRLDTTTLTWSGALSCSGTPPTARYCQSSIISGNYMYIFGGYTGSYQQDTHRLDISTVLNGRPVMKFDGTDNYLANTSITGLDSMTGCTCFCVGRTAAQADNRFWWMLKGTNQAAGHYINSNTMYTYASDESNYCYGAKAISGTNNVAQLYTTVFDGSLTGDANRLKLYQNGTQLTSLTIPTAIPADLDSGVTVLGIGYLPGTGLYHKGDIALILIFSRALTTAERQRVELWLATRYGITLA